jgi:transposase-like protein
MNSNCFLTVAEIAKRFDVHISTVHVWIRAGHFPNARRKGPGKKSPFVVPESDVIALERKLEKPVTSPTC